MKRKFFLYTFYSFIYGMVIAFGSILTGKLECIIDITTVTGVVALIATILVFVVFFNCIPMVFLQYEKGTE